jgi:hypothetical protein
MHLMVILDCGSVDLMFHFEPDSDALDVRLLYW